MLKMDGHSGVLSTFEEATIASRGLIAPFSSYSTTENWPFNNVVLVDFARPYTFLFLTRLIEKSIYKHAMRTVYRTRFIPL